MKTPSPLLAATVGILLSSANPASARPPRVSQVPNGAEFGCALCHVSPSGGTDLDVFGEQVLTMGLNGTGATATVNWPAIVDLDADGDGLTNGEEVDDPDGDEIPNGEFEVSDPGDANDPGDPDDTGAPDPVDPGDASGCSTTGAAPALAMGLGLPPLGLYRRRR
ncbi:MAG: hypothetical protein AAF602_07755 [Myxococcota bacterium]